MPKKTMTDPGVRPDPRPDPRYEVKLLVKPEIRADLLAWLRSVLAPDPAAPSPYRVSSLYYDTDDMAVYRHKKDGLERRFKLRLRIYPDAHDDAAEARRGNLEIKWKIGALAWKDRCPGAPPDLHALALDRPSLAELPVLAPLLATYRFQPQIIVDYERYAFLDHGDSQTRVTLDGPVWVRNCARLADFTRGQGHRHHVARSYFVLEVKFQRTLPFWLTDLAQRWEMPQVPFSKYVESVNTLLALQPYDLRFAQIKPINDDVLAGFTLA